MIAVTETVRARVRLSRVTAVLGIGLVLALGAAAILLQPADGDYDQDAGPAVQALIDGDLGRFFTLQPLMGSLSVLLRAPFAFAADRAGGGDLDVYRAGALACVLAACGLAVALVRLGSGQAISLAAVALLAVFTPASRAAINSGHPEEILGAVLCVAAVLLARRRPVWAGVALGLALATKQWAVLAVVPVVLAAPRGRRAAVSLVAVGVALVFTLPLVAGDFGAFTHTSHMAANSPTTMARATAWFLFAHPRHFALHLPPGFATSITIYSIPAWLAQGAHALVVAVGIGVAVIGWRRRSDPLALLALVFLARCVLDPVDNEYYHLPFLLALLAYETASARRAPIFTVISAAGLWLTFDVLDTGGADPHLTNAVYLAWTAGLAAYLLHACGLMPRVRRDIATGELELPTPRG